MSGGSKPSVEELAHTAAASDEALASGETLTAGDVDVATGETAAAGTPTPSSGPAIRRAKRPSEVALPRGAQLGRYIVVDKLGGGGMGIVYTAYDPELDRKVALKVMKPSSRSGSEEDARARLLREAQAMARLAHPNVVPIYDVGTVDSDVFVAMELVAGMTLGQWLEKEPRDWRTIVGAFTDAARGLVAAHAAGLVHRDFKPDNVIVGADGRIRVLDFGLARADGVAELPADKTSGSDLRESQRKPLSSQLTRTGALLGTPLYMSPEQWNNTPADARSDQFSFCVSLFEALWGKPPFAGKTIDGLSRAVLENRLEPIPSSSEVPARIRDAVLRGLSIAPAERFPTLQLLLDELGEDPRAARRKRILVIAGATVVAASLAAIVTARAVDKPAAAPAVCGSAKTKLVGVWDANRRAQLHAAFAATDATYSADAEARVAQLLDAYADAWVAMHEDTCRATNVRHEQSAELLDLRMACLDQHRSALGAQVDVLARADKDMVLNAVGAAQKLPSLALCADAERLKKTAPPPTDPHARAELEALRARLQDAQAKVHAGEVRGAVEVLGEIATRAQKLGYAPFTAEVLDDLGQHQAQLQQYEASYASLRAAVLAAETAGDGVLAGQIWTRLVYAASQAGDYDKAVEYGKHAEALLSRTTSIDDRTTLEIELGSLAYFRGEYESSRDYYERALAEREKAYGPTDYRVGLVLDNLGITLESLGKKDEALAVHRRAVAIVEQTLGTEHPEVATSLNSLGVALHVVGKDDEALALHRRALAIFEKTLGADNAEVGATHSYIATVLIDRKQMDAAVAEFTQALSIEEAALGPDHPNLAYDLLGLAEGELAAGKQKDALAHYERALALREAHGSQPVEVAEARFSLARALVKTHGDRSRAVKLATQARDTYRADEAQAENAATVERWLAAH